MKKHQYTYLLTRLPIGLSFLGHGAIRIINLEKFSGGLVKQFDQSMLPEGLISVFGHVLPFVEALIGILLMAGLFTRFALVLAICTMMVLIFGSSMIQQWNGIFTQLFYCTYLVMLFNFSEWNRISIDGLRSVGSLQ